jgi:glycosyltransferase involved in cell wall biosynthesis
VLGQPLLPGLAGRLTRERYDAVVMALTGRLMVPYVYTLARTRRMPFVLWSGLWDHPTTPFHRATRRVLEALYRRSDAIVVYGDHVRRALVAVDGVEDSKIFTAGQAVEADRFTAAGEPAGSKELVFIGRFEAEKGVDDLFDAFAAVGDAGARLSLIGNGSLDAHVRSRAAEDPRIEVIGHVAQDELPRYLARARAVVVPSVTTRDFREPWGLVVNEAMHAGLPVIATDSVGAAAHGLVEDGVTGFVVPERDPTALARAMNDILAHDDLSVELGRDAQERVAQYTFHSMANAFERAVEHAIGCRGAGEKAS